MRKREEEETVLENLFGNCTTSRVENVHEVKPQLTLDMAKLEAS
jgi:hypothetical protein